MENIQLKEGFTQVCVWPGVNLGEETPEDFENFADHAFGVEIQFLEVIETYPDYYNDGSAIPDTGGRSDLFFAINPEDSQFASFCVKRLPHGIRWIEDVYYNEQEHLYPERVRGYMSWNPSEE